ncbi:UDP-N-acetylmuramoyl-tripeptide--D-alanyl-D-alanine ligase [Anaeromicrobium sediminis]|uniref:Mur ligase central domain-containing protein n=1 Tax=Anaeromicrobium sediminis TaxID=1478221 RepID=A0A267MJ39_9FIRM|nr:hypothetical protein [Anaeromicrobium sediminis]PAB59467.1 hypothetical protein CCE28_09630 [Anaeromicrobium sediminis]
MSKLSNHVQIIGVLGDENKISSKIIKHVLSKKGYKIRDMEYKEYILDYEGIDILLLNLDTCNLEKHINLDILLHIDTRKEDIGFQRKVLNYVKNNGVVIMNEDDNNTPFVLGHNDERLVVSYGMSKRATLTASSLMVSDKIKLNCFLQRSISARGDLEVEPVEFPVIINSEDEKAVYNSLGAIGVLLLYGIDPYKLLKFLEDMYIQ